MCCVGKIISLIVLSSLILFGIILLICYTIFEITYKNKDFKKELNDVKLQLDNNKQPSNMYNIVNILYYIFITNTTK